MPLSAHAAAQAPAGSEHSGRADRFPAVALRTARSCVHIRDPGPRSSQACTAAVLSSTVVRWRRGIIEVTGCIMLLFLRGRLVSGLIESSSVCERAGDASPVTNRNRASGGIWFDASLACYEIKYGKRQPTAMNPRD